MSAARIVTINDAEPTAEAVLVRGGKIVAVGARAEVEKQAQGPIATVDLKGKALLPASSIRTAMSSWSGSQALAANLLPAPDGEGNDIAALQRILRDWIGKNGKVIDATASSSASATATRSSKNSATRPAPTSTPF